MSTVEENQEHEPHSVPENTKEQPSTNLTKSNIPSLPQKQDSQSATPQNEPSSTSEITKEVRTPPNEPSQNQTTREMAKNKSDPTETLKPYSATADEQPLTNQAKTPDISTEKPPTETLNQEITDEEIKITKSIDADIMYIWEESSKLSKYRDHVLGQLNDAKERFEDLKKAGAPTQKLLELKKEISKLSFPKHKDPPRRDRESGFTRKKKIPERVMKHMPRLHRSRQLESSPEMSYFEAGFGKMSPELRLCLLSFSIFPENAVIKKRLMVYWWIADWFVSDEYSAGVMFRQLAEMGFIEPVDRKRHPSVCCFTMHPFVRLALVRMAQKEKLFSFDEEGMASEEGGGTFRACMMGRGEIEFQNPKKLYTVFNINGPILDFQPEWFSRMKNLNVLYLGRWKVTTRDHIKIAGVKFLDGLSSMDHLRFLSLQGVSGITKLPDSITELSELIILDLRACRSLESIPEGIGSLENLTFLDFSDCHLLEHMPKELSSLKNLKVFKGFVVSKNPSRYTCSLEELAAKLKKLIKLCIYTSRIHFPEDKDLKALQSFEALKKLTIAWGTESLHLQPSSSKGSGHGKKVLATSKRRNVRVSRPMELEKLDLKFFDFFPREASPAWLMPSSLRALKKLYIRGGQFSDLGQFSEDHGKGTWGVEILRLKDLSDLEMDWRQLMDLFPNLVYLENVNCPKLSFFPSNGYGVWTNKEKLKQMKTRS